MKELSTEEKAKAYDKAIERAKELLEIGVKDTRDKRVVLSFFPELKESEDEKVIRDIKVVLECSATKFFKEEGKMPIWYDRAITWLEKQGKETVSQSENNDSLINKNDALKNAIIRFFEDRYPKAMEIYDGDFTATIEQVLSWLEKQGKQNINILWHDISEEPEEQREIFCKWKGSDIDAVWHDVAFYHADTKTFWDGEHQIEDVIKWAYIDEMFKNPNPYSGTSLKYDNHTWGMCARDGGVEISIDNELKAFVSVDKSFIYPVSQSYLAPKSASQAIKEIVVDNANKVEPKFHEGDWVAINPELRLASPLYIKDIDKSNYRVESLDGNSGAPTIDYLDNHYHLWTIEDAKDGDVLYLNNTMSESITLYKSFKHGIINKYASYNKFGFESENYLTLNDGYITPATKEQRDLLFAEMKKAGYKWDANKKELEKIEQIVEIPFGAKDSELQEDTYYVPDGYHAEIKGNEVVIKKGKQKTTWKPTEKQINAIRLARSFVTDDLGNNPTLSEVLKELEEQLKKL